METLYAPYLGEEPAAILVNGHRIVVLSTDQSALEERLPLFGGDSVHPLDDAAEDNADDVIQRIAEATHAHVVVTPREVTVEDVLHSLEESLPWLQ